MQPRLASKIIFNDFVGNCNEIIAKYLVKLFNYHALLCDYVCSVFDIFVFEESVEFEEHVDVSVGCFDAGLDSNDLLKVTFVDLNEFVFAGFVNTSFYAINCR